MTDKPRDPMKGKLERYLAFAYDDYYPGGGWGDFCGSYATLDDAVEGTAMTRVHYDYYQCVDSETGKEVHDFSERVRAYTKWRLEHEARKAKGEGEDG